MRSKMFKQIVTSVLAVVLVLVMVIGVVVPVFAAEGDLSHGEYDPDGIYRDYEKGEYYDVYRYSCWCHGEELPPCKYGPQNGSQPAITPTEESQPATTPTNESQPATTPTEESQPVTTPTNESQPATNPTDVVSPIEESQPATTPANESQPTDKSNDGSQSTDKSNDDNQSTDTEAESETSTETESAEEDVSTEEVTEAESESSEQRVADNGVIFSSVNLQKVSEDTSGYKMHVDLVFRSTDIPVSGYCTNTASDIMYNAEISDTSFDFSIPDTFSGTCYFVVETKSGERITSNIVSLNPSDEAGTQDVGVEKRTEGNFKVSFTGLPDTAVQGESVTFKMETDVETYMKFNGVSIGRGTLGRSFDVTVSSNGTYVYEAVTADGEYVTGNFEVSIFTEDDASSSSSFIWIILCIIVVVIVIVCIIIYKKSKKDKTKSEQDKELTVDDL